MKKKIEIYGKYSCADVIVYIDKESVVESEIWIGSNSYSKEEVVELIANLVEAVVTIEKGE